MPTERKPMWSEETAQWRDEVAAELRVKGTVAITTLDVAACALELVNRDPSHVDHLRLLLDALDALKGKRGAGAGQIFKIRRLW